MTGARSGPGYPKSEALLKRGASLSVAGREKKEIADADRFQSEFIEGIPTLVIDGTKQDPVQKGIEGTAAESGRPDLL